jgi:hypothetical protein
LVETAESERTVLVVVVVVAVRPVALAATVETES